MVLFYAARFTTRCRSRSGPEHRLCDLGEVGIILTATVLVRAVPPVLDAAAFVSIALAMYPGW